MPYLHRSLRPQPHPVPGVARTIHSSGQSFEQLRQGCLQSRTLFEDADFPASNSSLFYSERPKVPFVWKRPGEIVENPEFILGGATRTDICQGELGDCWLLAAIASLTLNQKALARVVPQDQGFGSGYAGIFHFQFWQHSEWLDVVIDDRLPTFRDRLVFLHSADHNEFWSALLEKAYAKLNGSYEALKGGSTMEAMEDFTGGVAETFQMREAPEDFYDILEKALKRGSLLGCSIDILAASESEARTPFGLIKGHAYTVTGLDQVNFQGQRIKLIRVRNPWGQVEWTGRWSDSSLEWRSVDLEEQKRLGHSALDDGEFWMAFEDFKAHFDKVEICNLTPDALEDNALHKWEVTIHQGSWVRGSTAGGCRNFLDTFWTNPQIKLSLTERDEGQEGCTFLAALMQKDRRKLKRFGANMLTIGYAIYQCPDTDQDQDGHLSRDFFRYHASLARSKTFINLREVSGRFQLPPGDYVLIPSTFEPHQEADFCLRIFSEKRAVTRDLDENVDIDLPEPPKPTPREEETEEERQFRALFQRIAGEDMEVSAEELEYVLNAVLQKSKCHSHRGQGLSGEEEWPHYVGIIGIRHRIQLLCYFKSCPLNVCELVIKEPLGNSGLLTLSPRGQTSGNGKLEFEEFRVFWDKLKHWMNLFLRFDVDKSGTMSSYELRTALKAAGFRLSGHLLQLIILRYTDESLQLGFDDYLNCLVRLENASRVFQALRIKNKDIIHLNINEFIALTMNI
ncbi:calpain-9 [Microtus ochrogaster]|uniref:Calpain-9 n=1 Tax=Microtus ochrogaster TaxID=79684 RepID=A0ABM1TXG2_MICOH|nr:calpain-9 [Microtus ochrogaster]